MEIEGDFNKIFYQQMFENFELPRIIDVFVSFVEFFLLQINDRFAYFLSIKCIFKTN